MGSRSKRMLIIAGSLTVVALLIGAGLFYLFYDDNDGQNDQTNEALFTGDPNNIALNQTELGAGWGLTNDTELVWDNENITAACRGEFEIDPELDQPTAGVGWTIYVFNTSDQANSYFDNGEDFGYWYYAEKGNWTNITGIGDETMYNDLEAPVLPFKAWPYAKIVMFRSANVVVVLGFVQKAVDDSFTMNDTFVDNMVQLQAEKIHNAMV